MSGSRQTVQRYSRCKLQLFPFFFRSTHFFFTRVDPPFDAAEVECKFPSPHFNAFIDLDGDCLADLFLVCQIGKSHDELSYQIWLNDKKGGFKQARKGPLPKGTRSVGFADMDRDGTIDMVLTICPAEDDCSLAIAYNSQIPLCSSSPRQVAGPCRDPEDLCVADPAFAFNLVASPDNHVSLSSLSRRDHADTDVAGFHRHPNFLPHSSLYSHH